MFCFIGLTQGHTPQPHWLTRPLSCVVVAFVLLRAEYLLLYKWQVRLLVKGLFRSGSEFPSDLTPLLKRWSYAQLTSSLIDINKINLYIYPYIFSSKWKETPTFHFLLEVFSKCWIVFFFFNPTQGFRRIISHPASAELAAPSVSLCRSWQRTAAIFPHMSVLLLPHCRYVL